MPTLEAFRDHGIASASLEEKTAEARLMLYHLEGLLGIRMAKVGRKLEAEGLKKFNAAFENVLELIETKKGRSSYHEHYQQKHKGYPVGYWWRHAY
jgi:transaldolase